MKKTYDLVLTLIKKQKGGSRRLSKLNDRAVKLNNFMWGWPPSGVVIFKRRPLGITKISKLPGYEFWCLIWMMVFAVVNTDEIIEDAQKRADVVQLLLGCL